MPPKKIDRRRGTQVNYNTLRDVTTLVPIPEKIKCTRCQKIKKADQYSNKQIEELKKYIHSQNGIANVLHQSMAYCQLCSGGQVVDLHCHDCNTTMGLDMFAKVQRKNPDNARCKKCMEGYLTNKVGRQDKLPEPTSSDESGSDESHDSNPYNTPSASARGGVDLPIENLALSKTGWTTQPRPGFHSASASSTASAQAPSFNPSAYRSSDSSVRGTAGPVKLSSGGRWAKPLKPREPQLPLLDSEEEKFRQGGNDSDEESADEDFVL